MRKLRMDASVMVISQELFKKTETPNCIHISMALVKAEEKRPEAKVRAYLTRLKASNAWIGGHDTKKKQYIQHCINMTQPLAQD